MWVGIVASEIWGIPTVLDSSENSRLIVLSIGLLWLQQPRLFLICARLEAVGAGCGVVPFQLLQQVEIALARVWDLGVDPVDRERTELSTRPPHMHRAERGEEGRRGGGGRRWGKG